MHEIDLLAKLFCYNLKDEALKWYYQLLENNIDSFEDLIRIFLHTYGYNITKKVYFKDI